MELQNLLKELMTQHAQIKTKDVQYNLSHQTFLLEIDQQRGKSKFFFFFASNCVVDSESLNWKFCLNKYSDELHPHMHRRLVS